MTAGKPQGQPSPEPRLIEQRFRRVRAQERHTRWTYVWRGVRRFVADSGPLVITRQPRLR